MEQRHEQGMGGPKDNLMILPAALHNAGCCERGRAMRQSTKLGIDFCIFNEIQLQTARCLATRET